MTVKELLNAFEEHHYTDVCITDAVYNTYEDIMEDEIVASWHSKDHDDWYCGQLDYFSDRDVNELKPYFGREVKNFYVINEVRLDTRPCIYITVK